MGKQGFMVEVPLVVPVLPVSSAVVGSLLCNFYSIPCIGPVHVILLVILVPVTLQQCLRHFELFLLIIRNGVYLPRYHSTWRQLGPRA